jgi:tetratricopeptide (TPR) repeat protein
VEKKQFHQLLENFTALTLHEAEELILLERQFPYSQVIRSLAARATQDNRMPQREDQLHGAAIYTTDRTVFKSIMTAPIRPRKQIPIEAEIKQAVPAPVVSTPELISAKLSAPENLEGDLLYEEVMRDVARLKELKHEFEEAVKSLEGGNSTPTVNSKRKKTVDPDDQLLTEIKSSKKKILPEGPRQKEQIEIIDQFIKTQPSIKGKAGAVEVAGDLADKNQDYNENIISETLAQILIKQGKKEKAIEVLKKLIWKFPQKKAYFAAQIEDLKK